MILELLLGAVAGIAIKNEVDKERNLNSNVKATEYKNGTKTGTIKLRRSGTGDGNILGKDNISYTFKANDLLLDTFPNKKAPVGTPVRFEGYNGTANRIRYFDSSRVRSIPVATEQNQNKQSGRYKIVGLEPLEVFHTLLDALKSKKNQIYQWGTLKVEWNEGTSENVEKSIRVCKEVILTIDDDSIGFIYDCGIGTYYICHIFVPKVSDSPNEECVTWSCLVDVNKEYDNKLRINRELLRNLISTYNITTNKNSWISVLKDYIQI